jgi:hypothetical protein
MATAVKKDRACRPHEEDEAALEAAAIIIRNATYYEIKGFAPPEGLLAYERVRWLDVTRRAVAAYETHCVASEESL